MSATRTADQLVREVAFLLGIVVASEDLGSVEAETIDKSIDPVLEEIASFCYVSDRDEIPARYFNTIARLVAAYAGAKFSGQPMDMTAAYGIEARLRYLVSSSEETSSDPIKSLYY